MYLVVELLSETVIKHKKPFPSLEWLGQASESIFLLDGGRTCILQLPSGGTKRHALRYRALHERLRAAVSTCVSPGGAFLAGVSSDGELFSWHRDSNTLHCIPPPPDFRRFMTCSATSEGRPNPPQSSQTYGGRLVVPRLFVDGSCERAVLVRLAGGPLLVWEDGHPPRWSLVTPPDHVPLPDPSCKEATADVSFSRQGERWARCSLVFGTEGGLQVSTVTLRWRPPGQLLTDGQCRFSARWEARNVPWSQIHPRAALVRHSGALVARYGCGRRLLAVAVNQRDSDVSRLVYLGGGSGALLVADLRGAGAATVHRRHQRQYWVAGLSWLAGDALLAAVTKQGSLALLSALGEPVPLLLAGAEASGRPAPYLLLHPLPAAGDSTVPEPAAGQSQSPVSSARSAARPLRQRFAVAAHPRRPVLLCSSGYMVTLAEVKCHAPLSICDRFISSASELLVALKRSEGINWTEERLPPPPSTPALKRPSAEPGGTIGLAAGAGRGAARQGRRVSFADHLSSEAAGDRRREQCPPESAADWRRVRAVCCRVLTAQALTVSRPGRCTQEWAGRAASVGQLARRLAATVLTGGCGRLGGPLLRLQRLLPLLGRLAALAAFSDWGGHVTLTSVGVLAALVEGSLQICCRLPVEDALSALSTMCHVLLSAERSLRRSDQSEHCVDQLERHEASALFSVILPAGNPCTSGLPATLSPLWQRLLRAVSRVYSRQRSRLTADQHRRLAVLLGQLQRRVQQHGRPLTAVRLPRRTPVLSRYLAGDWAGTEARLLTQLDSALAGRRPARRASRPALGLLYLHVAGGRLRRALETADATLLRCAAGAAGRGPQLGATLRHPAGRRLLRSLARLMARYHLAAPLSVQPPHDARPEPALTDSADLAHNVVSREVLTADISNNYLTDVWNPQHAFKLLVCCGLLDEAVWFARELGDWRTALLVCVLKTQLPSYSSRCPAALSAEGLLSAQAASYLPLPAASLEVSSVRRLLLAALLAGVALVPDMLAGLVRLLRQPLRQLPCLVPAGQPLPAVPLYLPAAGPGAPTDQLADPALVQELQARRYLAEAVQKILSVLRAAGLLERCILQYLTALKQACRRLHCEQEFRAPTLDASLEGVMRQLSAQLAEDEDISQRQQQLEDTTTRLRHLCLLLFLLHSRDKLSSALRTAQSETTTPTAATDSALQIVSLTATLQPLSSLAGWSAELAALALDAALTVDPLDRTLVDRLVAPLAESLADMAQLSHSNQQRLRVLLGRWEGGPLPPASEGCQLAQHKCTVGRGGQQLLDSCRLQQLRPISQLLLLPDGEDRLFGGPMDPSPMETQPPYLEFLRTMLDVAAPAGLAATPAQPLLAGWQTWHERNQLSSPAFLAGYRKMVATAGDEAVGKKSMLDDSNPKASSAIAGMVAGAAPSPASAAGPVNVRPVRRSRSAGQLGDVAAPARRGLFRCVSFSDIWRPTGGDEEFLLAGDDGARSHRRQRSRSADSTVCSRGRTPSGRSWKTLPRQRTKTTGGAINSQQGRGDSRGGGDSLSLKHPAFCLSKGRSVPRLKKYERVEKLMGWFLLWRHREIRMDLVKPFSGPRIALRPAMPDILVYIWLTDHVAQRRGQGRERSAPARRLSGATPMEAEMAKPGNTADTSSSDDNAVFGENRGEDPMLRHRGQFMRRGRSSGYVSRVGYADLSDGYRVRDSRQYERPSTTIPDYGNRSGQPRYEGGGNRYQAYGNPSRGMENRGYENVPYQRYGFNQGMRSQSPLGFSNQGETQRFGEPELSPRGFEDSGPDVPGGRHPRHGGSLYRPYGRRPIKGARPGGSAPPAPGRRSDGQQVRFAGSPGARPVEKWGSWDDFRAAPVSVLAGHSPSRSFGVEPSYKTKATAPHLDDWGDNMRTLVSPSEGGARPPPEPPAGWERRAQPPAPPRLGLPAGTAPGWDKTLHAVRVGEAGAHWKHMHGLDKVEGDECFMVYDDKIVRMENFTANTGATIDVVEKVAVYSPPGSARLGSGRAAPAAVQPVRQALASGERGRDGAPCVDCEWKPWSSSNLGAQRQADSAPAMRSTAALPTVSLQVPKSATAAGGKPGCVDCEWQQWSASTLKSAAPASERTESPAVPASERAVSAGAAPSRSDMSMSRQSELSERSDLISQLSDEVRQLRQEQQLLRRELAARSSASAADVNIPQLTRLIDQINDALEVGLARLQRGEVWRPQPIHAPLSLQPYVQAMKLPAPLLNAIIYDPESRYGSRPGSRSASRPDSGRIGTAPGAEVDAGYRRVTAEQISQLVAEEVRKALREAAPGSGSSEGRQARRRPRSTSPAPVRDIIVHQPVRRTHSHDPKTGLPPSAPADVSGSGLASRDEAQSSRSSSPPPSSAPPSAYRDYPFLLHLEDGGAAQQIAARQVRAVQQSPTARKIVQLLRDSDTSAPGGEVPDLVDRVLGVHRRSLEGVFDRKTDNMRAIQLLHDISEDEEKVDNRTAQEIRQLDDEIATLKRTLRALDSTEKISVWRSPSDELRYLKNRMRELEGSPPPAVPQDDIATAEEVVVTGQEDKEQKFVSEGTGSECKVKQKRRPDGRKHTQIVYDTGQKKSPVVETAAGGLQEKPAERGVSPPTAARTPSPKRRGHRRRLSGAEGHMDVDLSEDEAPQSRRVHRRFAPASSQPEATRSTPDTALAPERPAKPLVSRSVFETTRAFQTSGEDRYIRAADLEPARSGPLASSSTAQEIEIGSYAVSEMDTKDMARPITTRDALGLAEGHDAEQQVSRERITKTGGQQTPRRAPPPPSPSPPPPPPPPPQAEVPEEVIPVSETGGPLVPSSTVPSDPLMRTVPSWGRETDSAAGVTDSMLKSYPSYLGRPEPPRPVSEEEHTLELGPIQIGISPNRLVGRLADIGTKLGQAVGLVEQQQQDDDEVRQVLDQLVGPAPSGASTDSLQPFSSALSKPTLSMEQRVQQPASSLDVMFSAQDTLFSADECDDSEAEAPAKDGAGGAETSPDPPGVEPGPDAVLGHERPRPADESEQ